MFSLQCFERHYLHKIHRKENKDSFVVMRSYCNTVSKIHKWIKHILLTDIILKTYGYLSDVQTAITKLFLFL